jgi:protein-tyrosine phosphatase
VIDLHCHVLPGIDDGARTVEESVALARAAALEGVSTIVATPHVSARYPNEVTTIARLVDELGARLAAEGVPVEIVAGAEISATKLKEIEPAQLGGLRLGDGGWLLLEPPFSPKAPALSALVDDLQRQGYGVVLAHPERCPAFHRDPAMLESLVRSGALTSVTAGSLVGRFGGDVRSFALDLADAQMLHNVASDAHDLDRRPPGIAAQIERAGLGDLVGWLTQEVPAAILAGERIPARPARALAAGTGKWRAPWRRATSRPERISRWPGRVAELREREQSGRRAVEGPGSTP